MIRRSLLLVVATVFIAGSIGTYAQTPAPPAQPAAAAEIKANDYRADASRGCAALDATGDACDVDLTTTIVAADGTLTREALAADPNAPIDCFYVYPTVSTDATPNSDMIAGPGGDERRSGSSSRASDRSAGRLRRCTGR